MNTELIQTADGSHSIFQKEIGEAYHSVNGALTESRHIFIQQGYHALPGKSREITILEVGFGTGLNALLTVLCSTTEDRKVNYLAVEPYPLDDQVLAELNYPGLVGGCTERNTFWMLHHSGWDIPYFIKEKFILYKMKQKIQDVEFQEGRISLVYYDAFSPDVQSEMWEASIFKKLFKAMEPGGMLLTYTVKGDIRRMLASCGFDVVKIPGPPGKREITRATKPCIGT